MRELGSVGSVCLRCQFRLLVTSRARARRAISTSTGAAVAEGPGSQSDPQNEGSNTPAAAMTPRGLRNGSTNPPSRNSQSGASPRQASSVAMFQSIVDNQARLPATPGSARGTASIGLVKDVARIQTMLERGGATLAEAYSYFEETVYPQIQRDVSGVPQIVRNQIAAVILNRLALEKPQDFESNLLPSVTRITEIMVELDVLRTGTWATLVIRLIRHLYQQKTVPNAHDSIKDFETAMTRRDKLLHDLIGAWRVFCTQASSTALDSISRNSQRNEAKAKSSPANQETSLQDAFGTMFPQYQVPSLFRPTFAAFATYKLLTDGFNRSRSIKEEAAPFLQMMKGLIFNTLPPRREDFKPLFAQFPDLPRFVWPAKREGEFMVSGSVFGNESDQLKATIHRQLGEAIKTRNLGAANKAWAEFWGEAAEPDAARISELVQCVEIFDYFIYTYATMWRPQQAIQVWNNMERIGIKATIKTWNSMLQGCIKANNPRGLRTVWDKLVTSGIQLDAAIWTARIHGLFTCGEPDAGLRALDEMAKIWAVRDDPRYAAIAVQPAIEPVNAALAGLLRSKRDRDAARVLAWASKQGINPDLYTFNTLLRPLVRRGDMDGIDNLFATMRSINIQADVATFTVILDGALNHIGDLPPDRQVALVERVFAAMKSSGVEINMIVYAKILYLLFREGARAQAPVNAVLAHIRRRGLELTPHILTMLAEHFFALDPPDHAAVTELIENRNLFGNRMIDRVFWERVIRGYCQAGEVRRALGVFDRVTASGTKIVLSALYELLLPLVEEGDVKAAMRVVEAAGKIGKVDDDAAAAAAAAVADTDGQGRRFWRHRFWHLAHEHGLMGPELVEKFRKATGN